MRFPLAVALVATASVACAGREPGPVATTPAPSAAPLAAPAPSGAAPEAAPAPPAPGVPTDEECTLAVEAFTPRFAASGPGFAAPPAVRKVVRTLTETVTVDGVRIKREFGGCHHVLERYTWHGVAVGPDAAANLASIADRLGRLPFADPADVGASGTLRAAATAAAAAPELRDGEVDAPCPDATCTFRFADERGEPALVAEYQFAL